MVRSFYRCFVSTANVQNPNDDGDSDFEENVVSYPEPTSNQGFSVENGMRGVEDIMLPSKQFFKISNFLKRLEESDWSSSSFDAHTKAIVLRVIKRVADADPYFATYSAAPQSSKYFPLGYHFYLSFTNFIVQGFGQPADRMLECRVKRRIRETIENFLDRLRKEQKDRYGADHLPKLVANLRELISSNCDVLELKPNFDEEVLVH